LSFTNLLNPSTQEAARFPQPPFTLITKKDKFPTFGSKKDGILHINPIGPTLAMKSGYAWNIGTGYMTYILSK
jgi:hypothetical protein